MSEIEEWRAVMDGWPYEVSNLGRIRSVPRVIMRADGRPLPIPRKILAVHPDNGGHLQIKLCDVNRYRHVTVHSLVAAAFHGPRPEGLEIRHLDGDPTNNRVENLRYGTTSENMLDRVRHGTHHLARKTHCPNGHPYSGDNLRINQLSGGRQSRACRACDRARWLVRSRAEGFRRAS